MCRPGCVMKHWSAAEMSAALQCFITMHLLALSKNVSLRHMDSAPGYTVILIIFHSFNSI